MLLSSGKVGKRRQRGGRSRWVEGLSSDNVVLTLHQNKIVVVQFAVALFVAKVVDVSLLRPVQIGKILESKVALVQFFPVDLRFPSGVEFLQNAPVLAQHLVHLPHEVVRIAVALVVVAAAAVGGAVFFILPSGKLAAAGKAVFLHNTYGSLKDLLAQICLMKMLSQFCLRVVGPQNEFGTASSRDGSHYLSRHSLFTATSV